ncbi:homeobox-DDT domain protein RLT2 [Silene latifolia]|uniref:homeobox-DDT domain protein RLT2 n=1 Tax=Silene latifolia TaxID=37657 RepID=UPI003D789584
MEGGSSDGENKFPETGGGGGGGGGSGGEPKSKRKMKTASQLEVLEKTYQVETYPSEALRADLSTQLGLTDRQLQMWFCHRRLKDRKGTSGSGKKSKKVETATPVMVNVATGGTPSLPLPPPTAKDEMLGGEFGIEHVSGSGSGSSPYGHGESRRNYGVHPGVAVPRLSGPGRHPEPSQSVVELRAIAFVEAQLGEQLREDGPALGMEFDPLPPGAFGAPMSSGAPQKPAGRGYEAPLYDAKAFKGSGRALQEYQFLPEQPTVKNESYERVSQPHYYGSPADVLGTKNPPSSSGQAYVHGYEDVPVSYALPSQSLTSQQGKLRSSIPSTSGDYDNIVHKSPYMGMAMESPFSAQPIIGQENAFMPSDRIVSQEDEAMRVERKRKTDESRIAKEVEAHEKRMRKELEKQDILRRKREENMRKEMERQDRERRKEEERLQRERLREEERYQREQKREMERREKYMLKESQRAEKMRQKEELRREREAARQKAANDRAVARRLAKESMELIEDERLELMEIAASTKGLPSIVALDCETLENLDSFRDMLRVFPPMSVQLKKPFAVKPWLGSEENVGNLLMVWRFLITFADVLGLWPFTLDEFVQAFHDYDPRLLGEIHVALLRTVIKDIEDVARTPSTGLNINQNSVANPGGGHPHIVEGAYTWGFDIRSWQRNLSPLTWPEILRQFALSAGFGPKLKKMNVEQPCSREEDEGDDGIDLISNLRTGATVENAVAIMRERGYSNPRRSRHRLTPGTVKFAAYYVLSLEGDDGLNILEVADRIQKSGLRDLTTSKTPEASIAAALSRDTKLFERTAPSTYCVRTPFRKDPTDAEAILSAAREKIRVFKSGLVDGEVADVEGVEGDEAEKDEDSESDTAEDPEVDDLATELTPNNDVDRTYDVNRCQAKISSDAVKPNGLATVRDGLPSAHLIGFKDVNNNGCTIEESIDGSGMCQEGTNVDHKDTDIDESFPGEAWVQGLMEGEYSVLSVEERLNALVALIGVANEGNSIRVVLEERLEAATALKKQMWAEVQLDKRRMKEEFLTKTPYSAFAPNKIESTCASDRSPMLALDENNETNVSTQQKPFFDTLHDNNLQADLISEKNLATPDYAAGSENLALQQSVYADRCRAQLKSYVGHKAEEIYVYRSLPLGQDRRRNRYWQFIASASYNDPGAGRIFVELHNGGWKLIDSEEAFDTLLASLDVRGVRESHLQALLQKVDSLFKDSVRKKQIEYCMDRQNELSVKSEGSEVASNPESIGANDSPNSAVYISNSETPEPSSSFQIECGRNNYELNNALRRYNEFEVWTWTECFSSSPLGATKYGKKRSMQLVNICECCRDLYFFEDHHCPTCHETYTMFDKSFNLSEHAALCQERKPNTKRNFQGTDRPPLRMRLLKAMLSLVEVCIPPEALQSIWSDTYRKSWGMKLHISSSLEDVLQALTLLEGAIKKDFLSPKFQATNELLASGKNVGNAIFDASNIGTVTVLPWIPHTTAAVALRLMELDSAVAYLPEQKIEYAKDTEAAQFLRLPSECTVVRSIHDDELAGPYGDDTWPDRGNEFVGLASSRGGRGRGRGRTRGGRSQRRVVGTGRRNVMSNERPGPVVSGWKSRSDRGKGGRKRGRRSARSQQKPIKKPPAVSGVRSLPDPILFDKSPPGFSGRGDWNTEETRMVEAEEVYVNDDSMSERSDYNDDNAQASGDDYDDMPVDAYTSVYNGNPSHLVDENDYNVDEEENDDDMDEDDLEGAEYEQEDTNIGPGFTIPDSDDEENGDELGVRDREQDDMSDNASTDYSSSSE